MAAQTPFASHKDCKIAIGLQSARGVEATTFYAIPTGHDDQELDLETDFSFFQYGGGYRGKTHYEVKDKVTGKFALPLVPGYVGVGDLYNWIWGRTNDAYKQGYWATIYKAIGDPTASNYWVEKYLDVKVTGGTIPLEYGMDFCKVDLNLEGMALPATGAGVTYPAAPDTTLMTTSPYRYMEAAIRLATGSSLAAEAYTSNHSLEFDNKIEAQNFVNGSTLAGDLPNTEWADWKGSFDRPFVDTTLRTAFLASTECQYELTLARGGTSCVFTMGRIVYTKSPVNPGTSGVVKQAGNAFEALCPLADATAEMCTIAETVGS